MPRIRYTSAPASLWIGLDPGKSTGVAIWDAHRERFARLGSKPFWDAVAVLDALAQFDPTPVVGVVVEDSRGLPLYQRHRHLPREARDRAARSVGQIDVQIDLLVQRCEALQLPVVLVEPSRREKPDAETFRRLTGYEGRTNPHSRDAGLLVFGRTAPDAAMTSDSTTMNTATAHEGIGVS